MTVTSKKRNSHTITQRVKMTKNSFLYCRNRTVQLQIQFMKQLLKPIAIHSVAVKYSMKHNIT